MVNKTKHYLFVKSKLGANTTFDIEQGNLMYADFSPTHHGLQCNHVGGTPEYEEIQKLCLQVVDLIKKIDILNVDNPEQKLADENLAGLHKRLDEQNNASKPP